jgi:hypothetical protein
MILALILHGPEAFEGQHPRMLTLWPGTLTFSTRGLRCCLATLPLRPRIVLADPIDSHGERA